MNFKTTLLLLVLFVGLGAVYFLQLKAKPNDSAAIDEPARFKPSTVAREFIEDKLGEPVKIVCKRKDGEEDGEAWVFEKDADLVRLGGQPGWRMTAPHQFLAKSWEINRFVTQFNGLTYDISFKPGDSGAVSAEDAGLQPPEATVLITDEDGKSVTVEIGKPASTSQTYVRIAGSDTIVVGKANLDGLVKDSALDYRDQQVWKINKDDVLRVEIFDNSDLKNPVNYRLSRQDGQWMFEAPVTAKATKKVDEMLRSLTTLRAIRWLDHREDRLAMYGLQPGALTLQLTVRETIEEDQDTEAAEETGANDTEGRNDADADDDGDGDADDDGDSDGDADDDATEPKTIEKTYVLHLSNRSPIGEDTKVYFRVGDEPIVGSLNKTIADRFKPAMNDWREMKLTTAKVNKATRIELTVDGSSAVLVREGAAWTFEDDGSAAERSDVTALLTAVADLKAMAFVDGSGHATAFGLADPQALVRLTIPGVEEVERITVGSYTDANTKRLVYVRRNEAQSIAKVRVADVQPLLKSPRSYRDRTVFNLQSDRIQELTLSLHNRFGIARTELSLRAEEDGWKLTAPVLAEVRQDRIKSLVSALAQLTAEAIVADEGALTAYGLHDPQARVTIVYQPPPTYRIEKQDGEGEEDAKMEPVEIPSDPQELLLSVTEHDGVIYAARTDRSVVYRIDRSTFDQLFEELRSDEVLSFDESKVTEFSISSPDGAHSFVRKDGKWLYGPEPDLPLDEKKVQNLLLQLKDLKTHRYVEQAASDLAPFDLEKPAQEIQIKFKDGPSIQLQVSSSSCDADPKHGAYARIDDSHAIFLLAPDVQGRYAVVLAELEAR